MALNPNAPRYPEVDTSLLFGSPNPSSPGYPEIDISLLPGVPGQRGPTGPTGPTGPAGRSQTIAYTHTQNAVSSTWTITHNLSFYPNVTTTDVSGAIIEGSVSFPSSTTVIVTFGIATTGFAYLS
jgi:hypothetical protein